MFVPLYVWRIDAGQIAGECPLVPGVTFKGATPAELTDEVRGLWPSLKAEAVANPLAIETEYAHAYEGRNGFWTHIPLATLPARARRVAKPRRVNMSLDDELIEMVDAAADTVGMTRSGFTASALREKLQRG